MGQCEKHKNVLKTVKTIDRIAEKVLPVKEALDVIVDLMKLV